MKINKIEQKEYVFNEKDMKVVKECLNYCYHRLTSHSCGLKVNLKELQRLRVELEIATKYQGLPHAHPVINDIDFENLDFQLDSLTL